MRVLLPFLIFLAACGHNPSQPTQPPGTALPKNIIVVIGDGMGPQQIGVVPLSGGHISMGFDELFKHSKLGVHVPISESSIVNDSACSATQLGSGCSCDPQQVGMSHKGRPCPSFLDVAKAHGKRAGVISDTRLTHATPASFSVHVEHRGSEAEIAEKMLSSRLDILMSGGLSYFVPKEGAASLPPDCTQLNAASARKDSRNLVKEFQDRGYQVVCSSDSLTASTTTPLLGLFAPSEMKDAFEEGGNSEPSLEQMLRRSFELLDNPAGFALMVEAGQIDWAGHDNDVDWLYAEMKRANDLLLTVANFANNNPDTLVLVTGDHETGGFGFSYRRARASDSTKPSSGGAELYFPTWESDFWPVLGGKRTNRSVLKEFFVLPENEQTAARLAALKGESNKLRKFSTEDAAHFLGCITKQSGKPQVDYARCPLGPHYPYDDLNPAVLLGRPASAASNVAWSTGTHTSTPVLVFSQGPGSEQFQGVMTSAELGQRLINLVGQE